MYLHSQTLVFFDSIVPYRALFLALIFSSPSLLKMSLAIIIAPTFQTHYGFRVKL
jgi:hypothetical protein